MNQSNNIKTSPIEGLSGDRSAPARAENGDSSSYFSLPRTNAIGQNNSASASKAYLGSNADGYAVPTTEGLSLGSFGNFRNDDQKQFTSFSTNAPTGGFQRKSSLVPNTRDAQRSEDVLGSMGVGPFSHVASESISAGSTRQNTYSHISQNSGSTSTAYQPYPHEAHGLGPRVSSGQIDISAGLNQLQLNDSQSLAGYQNAQRNAYQTHESFDRFATEDVNYQDMSNYGSDFPNEIPLASYQSLSRLGDRDASPAGDFTRGLGGSFYPSIRTPPVANNQLRPSSGHRMSGQISDGQAALLDRRLRGLQQDQDPNHAAGAAMHQRLSFPSNYELSGYSANRLNGFSPYLQMPYNALPSAIVQRAPHREPDPSQVVRSPLLEEFRTHNKSNKRYELKVRNLLVIHPYPSLTS
jgi:mRNA-binding protein PUF3